MQCLHVSQLKIYRSLSKKYDRLAHCEDRGILCRIAIACGWDLRVFHPKVGNRPHSGRISVELRTILEQIETVFICGCNSIHDNNLFCSLKKSS